MEYHDANTATDDPPPAGKDRDIPFKVPLDMEAQFDTFLLQDEEDGTYVIHHQTEGKTAVYLTNDDEHTILRPPVQPRSQRSIIHLGLEQDSFFVFADNDTTNEDRENIRDAQQIPVGRRGRLTIKYGILCLQIHISAPDRIHLHYFCLHVGDEDLPCNYRPVATLDLAPRQLLISYDGQPATRRYWTLGENMANTLLEVGGQVLTNFVRTGSRDDLEKGVEVLAQAGPYVRLADVDGHFDFIAAFTDLRSHLSNVLGRMVLRPPSPPQAAIDSLDDMEQGTDLRARVLSDLLKVLLFIARTIMDSRRDWALVTSATLEKVKDTPKDAETYAQSAHDLADLLLTGNAAIPIKHQANAMEQVIDDLLVGDPKQPDVLFRIAKLAFERFQTIFQTGSAVQPRGDLDICIKAATQAMASMDREHKLLAPCSMIAAEAHGRIYIMEGTQFDLDQHYRFARFGVDSVAETAVVHPRYQLILASALKERGKRYIYSTGAHADDLKEAVVILESLDLKSNALETSSLRADYMRQLADCYVDVATFCSASDPEQSLLNLYKAVQLLSDIWALPDRQKCNHPACEGLWLHSLGMAFKLRSDIRTSSQDLDNAINAFEQGTKSRMDNVPWTRALLFLGLGVARHARLKRTRSKADAVGSFKAFLEAYNVKDADPKVCLVAAIHGSVIALDCEDDTDMLKAGGELVEDAMGLVPVVISRSLTFKDAYRQIPSTGLQRLPSIASIVLLLAGRSPEKSLLLLEAGRGILAGLLMDIRTKPSSLGQQWPSLADDFDRLRIELDSQDRTRENTVPVSHEITDDILATVRSQQYAKSRRDVDNSFQQKVSLIRTRPGYEVFLQQPQPADLAEAARRGPIIAISCARKHSYAFIVDRQGTRTVRLPKVSDTEVENRIKGLDRTLLQRWNADLTSLLKWLWEAICRPCLEEVGITGPPKSPTARRPRVWWIPSGSLSRLPLHAAGCHDINSTDSVMDWVVSSYATTIRAILHARRRAMLPREESMKKSDAVLIAMSSTPGQRNLRFAEAELKAVHEACASMDLNLSRPRPYKAEVLACMTEKRCSILHFAGHGESNAKDPSASRLLLQDWQTAPLTVENLQATHAEQGMPFLAYLSSCSTGGNTGDINDENLHMCNAFQVAGFRNVIGTLWKVRDPVCVEIARIVYQTMTTHGMTDDSVSRGLHAAIMGIRHKAYSGTLRKASPDPSDDEGDEATTHEKPAWTPSSTVHHNAWIPFIHYGP